MLLLKFLTELQSVNLFNMRKLFYILSKGVYNTMFSELDICFARFPGHRENISQSSASWLGFSTTR